MFKFFISTLIALSLFFSNNVDARKLYVDWNTGVNTNNGLTQGTAKKHPNAFNGLTQANDTVIIAPISLVTSTPYDTVNIIPTNGLSGWVTYICSAGTFTVPEILAVNNLTRLSGARRLTGSWTQNGNVWTYSSPVNAPWNSVQYYSLVLEQDYEMGSPAGTTAASCTSPGDYAYSYDGTKTLYYYPRNGANPNNVNIRVSQIPVVTMGQSNQSRVRFVGLTMEMGAHAIIQHTWADAAGGECPDSLQALYCNFYKAADMLGANNTGLITAGNPGGTIPGTIAQWGVGNLFYGCNFDYCVAPGNDFSCGSGFDIYSWRQFTIDSCYFGPHIKGAGISLKMGYAEQAVISYANHITRCTFEGSGVWPRAAVWAGPKEDSLVISECNFINIGGEGVDIHSTISASPYRGRLKILNNNFINCGSNLGSAEYDGAVKAGVLLMSIAQTTTGSNEISGNIFYYTLNQGANAIIFYASTDEGGIQTPPVETFWTINNNIYYFGAQQPLFAFSSNNSSCTGNTFAAWQACGFGAGSSVTNPNFGNVSTKDFSRTSSTAEMNRTYLGRTHTRFGSWQPGGVSCTTFVAPTLLTPANNSTDLSQPISIDWSDIAGATNYNLQVDNNSDFSSTVVDLTTGTSNYSASGLSNNTTYYWRVRTQNSCGWGSYSSSFNFATLCVTPSLSTLSSPANGATSQTLPVTLDWTDGTNATSYDVQIDNNSDFSSPTISTNVVVSTYSTSSLAYSTTYYWRVRGLNACGNSGYTASRSFTTGTQPPASDSLIVLIAGNSDDGFVYFDGNTTYNSIDISNTYTNQGNGGPEPHTGLYNFIMNGVNLNTVYDSIFLILMPTAADAATTVNFRVYVHDINNSPTFSTIADYNARALSSGYVDWNSVPPSVVGVATQSPNLASIINPLFAKAGWSSGNRISIFVKNNASSYESYRRFTSRENSTTLCAKLRCVKVSTVTNIAPTAPKIKYPLASNGTWINPYITVYNSTDENLQPLTYSFEVSTNSGFTNIVASTSGVTEGIARTSWRCTPNLSVNTVYYVRARAYDGVDYSAWSSTVSFFTYPNTVTLIDQTWRNANDGILNTAGQTYVMTEDINTTTWGFIIRADGIKFDMNHYTLVYDNKDSVGITNSSFETADTDTNVALGWTMGTGAKRKAGHYLMYSDWTDSPSLYSGNYALAVQMPLDSSLTVTSSLYTFASGYRYNVSVMVYNHYANSATTDAINFRIKLIDNTGVVVYSGSKAAGRTSQGFIPICVEFYASSTVQYRIGLEVIGGAGTPAGYVYFDDARIQTDSYHGISIGIDTTRNSFQATYMTGNFSNRVHHNSVYSGMSAARGIDGVLVENGTIRQGNGRCFNSNGIYIGLDNNPTTSPCANDTIYNVNVIVNGPLADNVVIEANRHRLSNMTWENYAPFGGTRASFPISYVRANYSPYQYGIVIDSCYGKESNGSGIVMMSRCDADGDGTDDYPLNKIYGVTLQTHTKMTNGFAIMSYGQAGLWIDSSFIFNDTGQFYGLGIQFAAQDPTCEQRPKITRSVIRCQPGDFSQEYTYYIGGHAKAVQFDSRTNFVLMEDDTIVVYSDNLYYDRAGDTKLTEGVGVRINGDGGNEVGVHMNRCKVTAIARGNDAAQCMNWYTLTTNTTDSLADMLVENSTFVTNDVWLGAISFSYNSLFVDNMFVLDSTLYPLRKCSANHINGIVQNEQNSPVKKIRLISNNYPDATTEKYFDSLYVKNSQSNTSYCSASREASYYLGHKVEVLVLDGVVPEAGATVTITDKNGSVEYSATTNAFGYVNTYAYEYYDSCVATTRNLATDRVQLNPHTITAVSGSQTASTQLTITGDVSINLQLSAGNTPPVLASIGNKTVNENATLSFGLTVTDADGQITDITTSTLPSGAVFTDNNNNTGSFSWTPNSTQSGVYSVTFTATDGFDQDQETITITVNDIGNQAPNIFGVGDLTAAENSTINFIVTTFDAETSNLPISIQSGKPLNATFTDNGNGTGTFNWVPGYSDAGAYSMTFYTTDGTTPVTRQMILTVTDINRAPVLAAIGNQYISRSEFLLINVTATDLDQDNTLLMACTGYPVGSIFTDNGGGNAQLLWIPATAGTYNNIVFSVTDGTNIDQETILIEVDTLTNSVVIYGTTNVEDTWLREQAPTLNYGNYSQGVIDVGVTKGYSVVRFKNISSLLPANAIITNAYINFFCEKYLEDGTMSAYRVFKPWVEGSGNGDVSGGATYNQWNLSTNSSWAAPGAQSASDAGVDNSSSGSGFDRAASSAGSISITRGGSYNMSIVTSLVQGWRSGTFLENGVVFNYFGNIIIAIYSTESEELLLTPKLIIEYTTSNSPNVQRKVKTPLNSILDNNGVL